MGTKKQEIEMKEEEFIVMPEEIEEIDPDLVDSEGNELLFEEGPTINYIEEMKSIHGFVYLTEIEEGEFFLWRPLARKEFKEIMKIEGTDALFREEKVCETCVIWPKKYNFMSMNSGKAGTPTLLSEQIMEKSGFAAKTGPMML